MEKKIFKSFFYIFSFVKIWLSCGPTLSPGIIFWSILNLLYWARCFHTSLRFSGQLVLRRRFSKMFLFLSSVKIRPPIVIPPYPSELCFESTWIYLTWGSIHTGTNFGQMVWRRFSKMLIFIFLYVELRLPHCSPTLPYPLEKWFWKDF